MKKIFQKLLQKFIKKAVNKAVSSEVPEIEPIVDAEPDVVPPSQESAIKTKTPWWVIFLKILSYIISLILGGVVTSCAPHIL